MGEREGRKEREGRRGGEEGWVVRGGTSRVGEDLELDGEGREIDERAVGVE